MLLQSCTAFDLILMQNQNAKEKISHGDMHLYIYINYQHELLWLGFSPKYTNPSSVLITNYLPDEYSIVVRVINHFLLSLSTFSGFLFAGNRLHFTVWLENIIRFL